MNNCTRTIREKFWIIQELFLKFSKGYSLTDNASGKGATSFTLVLLENMPYVNIFQFIFLYCDTNLLDNMVLTTWHCIRSPFN
jgi:hypothetical protein